MSTQALIHKPFEINDEMVVTLEDALTIGDIVAKSKMFPDVTDQAKAVVAILAGRELGIPPMASLRGIHVVKGKVEIGAGLLAGMIKQSKKYAYKVLQSTDQLCDLAWFENGEEVGRSHFTLLDAQRAKLIKPDSNWEKFPKAMCFARALTAGQKMYCPDIGLGAVYAPGEIPTGDDPIDITPEVVTVPTVEEIFSPRPLPDTPLPTAWTDDSPAREIADQQIANTIGAELKEIHSEIKAEAPAPDPQPDPMPARIQQAREKNMPPPPPKAPPRGPVKRNHSAATGERLDKACVGLTTRGVTGAQMLDEVNDHLRKTGKPPIATRYALDEPAAVEVCQVFEDWIEMVDRKAQEARGKS